MLAMSSATSVVKSTLCTEARGRAGRRGSVQCSRAPSAAACRARGSVKLQVCAHQSDKRDSASTRLRAGADAGERSSADLSRRALLLAGALVAGAPAARADEEVPEVTGVPAEPVKVQKAPANCQILVVRKGPDDEAKCEWGTINGALDVAPEGSIILVSSGFYEERVVVRTPNITLRSIELDKAVIAWSTPNPYEAALQCEAQGLTVEGFAIKHNSPSIASNYGILVASGTLDIKARKRNTLAAVDPLSHLKIVELRSPDSAQDCEVTSDTGTGLGVEGGSVKVDDCRFLNNKRHGIMLLGPLDGAPMKSIVMKSQMKFNGGSGAVVRDGADVLMDGNDIQENADYGVFAKSASLEMEGNVVCDNRKGTAVLELMDSFVGEDNNVFDDKIKVI